MNARLVTLLLGMLVCLTACAGRAVEGGRPAEFTLAATVNAPEGRAADRPRALRRARYIVETDRELRLATGQALDRPWGRFPPRVRRLTPQQMDDLWRRVEEAGLADTQHPGAMLRPAPEGGVLQPEETATAVFEVVQAHAPIIIVVVLDDQTPESRRAALLLDHLAELAWISE